MERVSVVKRIRINTLLFSSVLHIGDAACVESKSRVLAVQREKPEFLEGEGKFEDYPIFTRPQLLLPITEEVDLHIENEKPTITVSNVRIVGLSTAAVFQVGSNQITQTFSRVKHVRHFVRTAEEIQGAKQLGVI